MKRSRTSKRATPPAADMQPAVVVAQAPALEWVCFRRGHVHDRKRLAAGERLQVTPAVAELLVDKAKVATRVVD